MNWFGLKPGRDRSRPVLSRVGVAAVGSWLNGDGVPGYEAQVRAGYCRNAVAQRAVKLVAEAVGGAPLLASDPALTALVGARSSGQPLVETVAAQLLLHGNAFVQVLRDADGNAAELFALRPERVTIEPDASGWPAAYRYTVAGVSTRLGADPVRPEVIHLKAFNPLDDHYGLGCLGAGVGGDRDPQCGGDAGTRRCSTMPRDRPGRWCYEAGGRIGAVARPVRPAARARWRTGFAGAGNAGRPMLLEGGLKWQAMSLSPADMDFVGLKAAAAREIALAFGVPPMLLGLPGDNDLCQLQARRTRRCGGSRCCRWRR